jgi:HK97 family phage major capsid protein
LGGTGVNMIGSQDLVNLESSVDPAYRNSRTCRYMLKDSTLQFFKGLLDKFGRPLWTPGVAVGAPDTLNGYRYVLNQSMPPLGASNVPMIFGDLNKFVVRKVAGIRVQRLVELYANTDQVGFQAFRRFDSNYISSGGRALSVLQNHS